jgi:phosphoribosylanthranilate isomerase
MVAIQIYGITVADDARLAADLGVDNVGVVVGSRGASWDEVDEDTAQVIFAALPSSVRRVAMTLSPEPADAVALARAVHPDVVHLVNVAERHSADDLRALRRRLGAVELMCTVPVRATGTLDIARRAARACDYLLLDTVHPATGITGASGLVHDWDTSAAVVAGVDVPVVLAGGLGPDNVADAIAAVRPWGVDSETRTGRDDDRRRKDPVRLARFVGAARDAAG